MRRIQKSACAEYDSGKIKNRMYITVRLYACRRKSRQNNLFIQVLPPLKSPLKFVCTAECTYFLYSTAHDVLTL